MATLRTERLLLRPASLADLDQMHAILSDPIAMAFWSTPPHETLEQTGKWLDAMIATAPDEGEDFVVEFEGRVVGKAGLYRFPEIGYIFHPDTWGHGFASEAVRRVIDRAFDVHRLAEIKADVDPRNERSVRLLTGLGFRETGRGARTWLVGETWSDSVYLSLEAAAWKRNRAGGDHARLA